MSTETYEKINAKDKPIAEDFVYVYSEIEDGGFRKVSKAMLKVLLGVATKLSELENDKAFITKTVSDLENYYSKSDTYSKDEIDNRISLIPRFNVQVVSSLPTTDISETTVYLVSSGDDSDNLYTEYINVNGLWEILGTQKIASVENAVLYTEQSLTDEQKAQARTNISAASAEDVRQVQEQIGDKVTNPTSGEVGQILEIETVDENGKPKTYKAIDKPTGGETTTTVQEYWGDFESNETNIARDTVNSMIMGNHTHEVGTSGTLRHNVVCAIGKGAVGMVYVESTGNLDYADKTGQTSVYVILATDYYGNAIGNPPGGVYDGTPVEVFPRGTSVIGLDGVSIGTVVSTSDATLAFISDTEIIVLSECVIYDGSNYIWRKVYRKGTVSGVNVTFDEINNPIGLLTINGTVWDMKSVDETYTTSDGQLNTNIVYHEEKARIAVVVNNTAVCVLQSTDFIDWNCVWKISDKNAHLEASYMEISYISNDYPTHFIAVRNKYGLGYITLYCLKSLSDTSPKKVKIPASSSRPQFVAIRRCYGYFSPTNDIYLIYTINGRKTAVVTKIEGGTDGTTGVKILTTPSSKMCNYPSGALFANGLWLAGTNGLQTDKNGISWAELDYSSAMTSYNKKMNEAMRNGIIGTNVTNVWCGTQSEYNAISSKSETTLYFIKEE